MPKLYQPELLHIAYSCPNPALPERDALRVSYRSGTGVFVCRYDGAYWRDDELTSSSLRVLRNLVPWLWKPGMPREFSSVVNIKERHTHPITSRGMPLDERKLVVKLYDRAPEEAIDPAEAAVTADYSYFKQNRAEEWVRLSVWHSSNLAGQAITELSNDAMGVEDMHWLWYLVIRSMQTAASEVELEETRIRRLSDEPGPHLGIPFADNPAVSAEITEFPAVKSRSRAVVSFAQNQSHRTG